MPISAGYSRLQLSLYVPPPVGRELEAVRRRLDPVQFGLIPAHVTLCREDELDDSTVARLASRLATPETAPVTLCFGPPESFSEHGVHLPCIAGDDEFYSLRQRVLGDRAVKRPLPHITLAHPRNPKSPANSGPASVVGLPTAFWITFPTVCLIRQDGPAPWRVVESFALEPDPIAGGGA